MRQSFRTQPALFVPPELFDHPALTALDDVEAVIDWSRIEALLPSGAERERTGRPGYPALTLFRALLLGQWYDLSDVKLSAQLARDLLFRKFCRLELDQGVPDDSTLGRFRTALGDRLDAVLAEVMNQLEAARVALAEGRVAIIDATVVEASRVKLDTRDPEAGNRVKVNARGRKVGVWGWQASVNADGEADQKTVQWTVFPPNGFIRRVVVSPGNRAEVDFIEHMVVGDEVALYADAGYVGPRTRALLERHRMRDRVQSRASRGHPLTPAQKQRNGEIAMTRGRVEAIFGHWKRVWGLTRLRTGGMLRAKVQIMMAAIGWNLTKGARFKANYG